MACMSDPFSWTRYSAPSSGIKDPSKEPHGQSRQPRGSEIVGSLIGARVLLAVPNERIRLFFVVVLVALALQMALSGFGVQLGGFSE